VLSRIAEALYWMGRYLERADDTARLLDVHVHRVLVEGGDDAVGASLLETMGVDPVQHRLGGDVDLWRTIELLAYDGANPSSVAGSLRLARENARGLRETLAIEVWEAVNTTYHELDQHVDAARTLGPHLFFRWMRDRIALVVGLIDSLLLHDDGWRFLTIGRCLERVDMTARLLGGLPANPDPSRWSGVLVSCGANDAFLRTYGGTMDPSRALAVLLIDEDFPRSVAFSLHSAEGCLRAVDAASGGAPIDRARALEGDGGATRLLGRMRAELEYVGLEDLATDLPAIIGRLQGTCARASDLIATRYFRRAAFIQWSPGTPMVGDVVALTAEAPRQEARR